MKLRLQTGAIRLRLSSDETQRLKKGSSLIETVDFPEGRQFRYELFATAQFKLNYGDNIISIGIPYSSLNQNPMKFATTLTLDKGRSLTVLVEKDLHD